MSLGALARALGWVVPSDRSRSKGWVGRLVEEALGATAGSRPVPDFQRIGVELKTLPVRPDGRPAENTYVCRVPTKDLATETWETSWVRRKLARVLWVPVEAAGGRTLAERRLGAPFLWSPTAEEDAVLASDWRELMDLVRLGHLEDITADMGEALHIRPTTAGHVTTWGVGADGHRTRVVPRGFYLRPSFTGALVAARYG